MMFPFKNMSNVDPDAMKITEDEGGDPMIPTQEGFSRAKKVIRNRGRKWEDEKEKREGAARTSWRRRRRHASSAMR